MNHEQYKRLDLGNRSKWDVIKNYQHNYRGLDLNGPHWEVIKNPAVYEPLMQEVEDVVTKVDDTYMLGQAIIPYGEGEYIKKSDEAIAAIDDTSRTGEVPQSIIPYGTIFDAHITSGKQDHPRIPKAKRTLTRRQRRELKKNPEAGYQTTKEITIVDFSEKGGE